MAQSNSDDLQVVGYREISTDYLQGFTTGALRGMQSRGEMPSGSFTIGRRRLWLRKDIERWVAELIATGTAGQGENDARAAS